MQQHLAGAAHLVAVGVAVAVVVLGSAVGMAQDGTCFGKFPTYSCTIGRIVAGVGSAPPCSPQTVTICDASVLAVNAPVSAVIVGDCFMGMPQPYADVILGGDLGDIINAGKDNNTICAGAGNDLVLSGSGDDVIAGGAGDDVVFGGEGMDKIFGGAGNDTMVSGNITQDGYMDVLDGGSGSNTCLAGVRTARIGCP